MGMWVVVDPHDIHVHGHTTLQEILESFPT